MSAATILIDRPACAVCAAWRYPCARCIAAADVIPDELIVWNHGLITSGGLGSTLAPCQGQPYNGHRRSQLTPEQREIMAWLRGPVVPLRERLSEQSRAAVGA